MTLTPAQLAQSMKETLGYTASDIAQALAAPPNSLSADVIAGALVSSGAYPNLTSAELLAALQSASPPLNGDAIAQAVSDIFSTPTIIGLDPSSADLGSADLTLTISGRGFKTGAGVGWNSTSLTPTRVADAQIVVTVPAAQLTHAGPNQVTVTNPGPVVSNSMTFVVNTPQPHITAVSPSSIVVGTADVTLTITGSGFAHDSVLMWNQTQVQPDAPPPNSTQMVVTVPNQTLRSASTVSLVVENMGSRLASQAMPITLSFPIPAIGSVSPASVLAGSPAQTLTIAGSGFASSAMLTWNGDQLTTSFLSATQLSASVTADRLQQAATAALRVVNVGYPGAQSDSFSFTVANPQPQISSLSPASGYAGDPDLQLTVYGSQFAPGAQVLWGSTPLTIGHSSADQLGVTVPASYMTTQQTVTVTVVNPGPGGGTSNGVGFALAQRVPAISSTLPIWGVAGHDLPITVSGSNFMAGATISWTSGGQTNTVTPTQVTATTLTATIPGSQVVLGNTKQTTDTATLAVVNPAPGGSSPGVQVTVYAGRVLRLQESDTTYLGYYSFEMPDGRVEEFNALQASGEGDDIYTPDPSGTLKLVGWGPFTWMLVKVDGNGNVAPTSPLQSGDDVRFMKDSRSCVNSPEDPQNDDTGRPYRWSLDSCGTDNSQLFVVYLANQLQFDKYDTVPFDEQFKNGPILDGSTVVLMAKGRTEWWRDSDGDRPEQYSWTVELPPPDQLPTWDD